MLEMTEEQMEKEKHDDMVRELEEQSTIGRLERVIREQKSQIEKLHV